MPALRGRDGTAHRLDMLGKIQSNQHLVKAQASLRGGHLRANTTLTITSREDGSGDLVRKKVVGLNAGRNTRLRFLSIRRKAKVEPSFRSAKLAREAELDPSSLPLITCRWSASTPCEGQLSRCSCRFRSRKKPRNCAVDWREVRSDPLSF